MKEDITVVREYIVSKGGVKSFYFVQWRLLTVTPTACEGCPMIATENLIYVSRSHGNPELIFLTEATV